MTSKINVIAASVAGLPAVANPRQRADAGAATDAVDATAAARDTPSIFQSRRDRAPLQSARVAKLRGIVLDGAYRINSIQIAKRLVEIEKSLP